MNGRKNIVDKMAGLLRAPRLTRNRMILALMVAMGADGLQILLGPLGWGFFDEIIDVIAMGLTSLLIGFHLLLLPTFAVEFIPVVDMLPTWTGCVAVVIALRKREQRASNQTIDVPPRLPGAS